MPAEKKFNKNIYAFSLLTQIGVFISATVLIFVLGGRYLDKYFNTSPPFLLFGIVFSAAVNIYGVYRLLKPLLENDKNK